MVPYKTTLFPTITTTSFAPLPLPLKVQMSYVRDPFFLPLQASMATVLWQMCALGAAMWVAQYVLTVALQTAAMRQVARIRTKVRRNYMSS